jgi:hypothetical protein
MIVLVTICTSHFQHVEIRCAMLKDKIKHADDKTIEQCVVKLIENAWASASSEKQFFESIGLQVSRVIANQSLLSVDDGSGNPVIMSNTSHNESSEATSSQSSSIVGAKQNTSLPSDENDNLDEMFWKKIDLLSKYVPELEYYRASIEKKRKTIEDRFHDKNQQLDENERNELERKLHNYRSHLEILSLIKEFMTDSQARKKEQKITKQFYQTLEIYEKLFQDINQYMPSRKEASKSLFDTIESMENNFSSQLNIYLQRLHCNMSHSFDSSDILLDEDYLQNQNLLNSKIQLGKRKRLCDNNVPCIEARSFLKRSEKRGALIKEKLSDPVSQHHLDQSVVTCSHTLSSSTDNLESMDDKQQEGTGLHILEKYLKQISTGLNINLLDSVAFSIVHRKDNMYSIHCEIQSLAIQRIPTLAVNVNVYSDREENMVEFLSSRFLSIKLDERNCIFSSALRKFEEELRKKFPETKERIVQSSHVLSTWIQCVDTVLSSEFCIY